MAEGPDLRWMPVRHSCVEYQGHTQSSPDNANSVGLATATCPFVLSNSINPMERNEQK